MKITVLDSGTTAAHDLSFDCLNSLGEVEIYDFTKKDLTFDRAKEADIVVTNKVVLNSDMLKRLENCKFISTTSTGTDHVDVKVARELGIPVCNVPSYSTNAVAQHVFAFLLNLSNSVKEISDNTKSDGWLPAQKAHFTQTPMFELAGKTIGLFGFGSIGKKVAQIALGFGMKVIATTRNPFEFEGVKQVDFETLLASSDFLSLHVPLSYETQDIINEEAFKKMKDGIVLINTARGRLIDETALLKALDSGKVARFCSDVLYNEPAKEENLVINHPKTVITPHIAWCPKEARQRVIDTTFKNIQGFLNKKLVNLVN